MATVSTVIKSNGGRVTSEHDSSEANAGLYVGPDGAEIKVVGVQGAAVADCTVAADGTSAGTQLNLLLARLRAHGLIAT